MIKFMYLFGVGLLAGNAIAQKPIFAPVTHLNFNSPESWALKYFTSVTLLSGLQPPEPMMEERHQIGSVTAGLELGWTPALTPDQARVGFSGKKQEDLNKAPIFARPIVRVGLPWKFSVVVAAPAPVEVFSVTPRLFAVGFERPIVERKQWRLGWRISGQLGSVHGPFTCPHKVLGFPVGSPNNPTGCTAESDDKATLRYGATELQFAYRMPKVPRLTPHIAGGINYLDSVFHVNAPLETRQDESRLWMRGRTFSWTAGASYLLTKRVALTVDAFYTPLGVRRNAVGPVVNDGLFNVRALLSYALR